MKTLSKLSVISNFTTHNENHAPIKHNQIHSAGHDTSTTKEDILKSIFLF